MNRTMLAFTLGLAVVLGAGTALAAEIVGPVQNIDAEEGTVTVEGIEFLIAEDTDFDMALGSYADLEGGQTVEIDFDVIDGRHVINQIRPEPF
ncbi:hypothetical protein SAMN05216421_0772 [Halopseudomonas xinjiangensis]|uniref:DUF5666 domain-containing protein n=1 Tax=Halopseudomonas xinjiangensis TaxID=487184 RepID=A0A1H1NWK7_9GAMM|nr:DUF5666 domain-containing protein [Halopseudomonas xinjiangensis]SDS02749.1 hypothetical protein SAMN05216421_0772 [Halopseudomonas xinjiangensis]